MKLIFTAAVRMFGGVLLLCGLLFLSAGTIAYQNAWLLMGLLFLPMLVVCAVLLAKDKQLLKKRLNSKESQTEQKIVVFVSSLEFLACFIIARFDFRLGWSRFPMWLTVIASLLFLAAYGLYAEVMRENAFLSRTIEIQEGQKVIDTGLYGFVRHPMYFSTVLLFWSMPLVLGSWFAFIVMLSYPLVLVKRIRNEESILENGLAGYKEYKKKVTYRMLPFIW